MENQTLPQDSISQQKPSRKFTHRQKMSFITLIVLLIILPLTVGVALVATRFNPRAYTPLATAPITPIPTSKPTPTVCQNLVKTITPTSTCFTKPSTTPTKPSGREPFPIPTTGYLNVVIVCANGYTETYKSSSCLTTNVISQIGKDICQRNSSCTTSTPTPTVRPTSTPTPTPFPTPTPTPTSSTSNYYLKTTNWVTASPNIASTVIHGCNPGDMAIGGGLDGYTGSINIWRTVRSGPSSSTTVDAWQTTVVNQDTIARDFTVTTKCLRLPR